MLHVMFFLFFFRLLENSQARYQGRWDMKTLFGSYYQKKTRHQKQVLSIGTMFSLFASSLLYGNIIEFCLRSENLKEKRENGYSGGFLYKFLC